MTRRFLPWIILGIAISWMSLGWTIPSSPSSFTINPSRCEKADRIPQAPTIKGEIRNTGKTL
jgi:hypothetical protein